MTRTKILLVAFAAAGAGCAARSAAPAPARDVRLPQGARVVDLTHSFDERTLYWPTAPSGFELERMAYGKTPGGFFYAANKLAAPEHGGTHLDAPIHFAEGKATVEAIPLARLVAPAVVVDITRKASGDADALLAPEDLAAFEAAHGAIERGTIVLVRTGWAERWPDRKRYLGDDTPGDASRLHFPGIGAAAAQQLVERGVGAVGIDTASIDHGPSKDFIAHQTLSAADIPAFENLASLADVPARGALVVALPMKIAGGSGGPLRIIAIVPGR
jgi:kynurenine formamidase